MVSTAPLCLSPRFPVCLLPPSDAAHLGDKSDGKSITSYKWRMVISYDGWRYQPAPIPTVQWHIEDALIQITKLQRGDLCLIGASRTDTGVHAFGQVAQFTIPFNYNSLDDFHSAFNGLLPKEIRIREISPAHPYFHARFSTTRKVYRYKIYNEPVMDPFHRLYTFHSVYRLNPEAMREAAGYFLGKHEFSSFGYRNYGDFFRLTVDRFRRCMPKAMFDQDQHTYLRQNLSTEAQRELTRMLQKMSNYALNVMVQDELRWRWDSKGEFTVRSAYRILIGEPTIGSQISEIWKLKIPPRMRLNRILTLDNLIKKEWIMPNWCILCKMQAESVNHMFNQCIFAKALYEEVATTMELNSVIRPILVSYTEALTENSYSAKSKEILLITQFILWRERGERIFRDLYKDTQQLAQEVSTQLMYMEIKNFK